ncbi:MAG: choice-of-anchor U domain-containing protein [Thermodesulfobacteriota bacterium]
MRLLLNQKKIYPLLACLLLILCMFHPAYGGEHAFLYDTTEGMVELGTLGGDESFALDINNNGAVTGFSNLAVGGSNAHAFIWVDNISGGTMTDIHTLTGTQSVGRALNDSNQVVGQFRNTAGKDRAFIWDSTNGMRDIIGTLGGDSSQAYDINSTGRVVGYSKTAGGFTHAFIWDEVGGIRDIGTLTGGTESYAYGINNSGLVVGYSNKTGSSSTFYLFTWDSSNPANPLVDRGVIIGERLKNLGINTAGQIGGHYLASSPNSHGFFYNGALTDIGVLPGDNRSLAFAINDSGRVVGYSLPSNHGILWDGTGGLVDFSAPFLGGEDRCFAYSINNSGQIVGAKTPNAPPNPPVFLYPTDGATGIALTVTIQTDAFYDPDMDDPTTPDDTHGRTRWQISTVPFAPPPTATDMVMDITSSTLLTSLTVPVSLLRENTRYYLRACFYDSRGARSDWTAISFTTATIGDDLLPSGGNGVPDTQDVDATVDMDANSVPDINQTDLRAVNTLVGQGRIAIKHLANVTAINGFRSIDPATITDMTNRPEMIPLGLISCRLAVTTPGATARITVYLSDPSPNGEWHKYNTIDGWQNYTSHAVFTTPVELTLELQDGGFGDADGAANGVIIDPSGFAFAASPNPPATPIPVSPANGAVNVDLAPTLQTGPFNDPDGNSHYRTEWEVSTDSGFSSPVFSSRTTTDLTTITLPEGTLASSTTYYWRVRFTDNYYAVSNWSAVSSFTTLNIPPAAPGPVSPADDAVDVSRLPTLTTGAYSDPEGNPHTQTQWQLSLTEDFAAPAYDLTSSTDLTTHTVPLASILDRGTLYFWRVRFYDDQGSISDWSTVFSFTTTSNTLPEQPSPVAPLDAAADVGTMANLEASAYSDLDGDSHFQTQWQISTSSDFSALILDVISDTHLTTLTVPDVVLNGGALYYWRTRYYDNQIPAGESAWSAVFSFTTTADSGDANANGIPDTQEVSGQTDLDGNGTPDINQNDIKSFNTLLGEAGIGVKGANSISAVTAAKSVDPAAITDATGRPAVIPLGLFGFRATTVNPGDTGEIQLYLSIPLPSTAWYAYDTVSGWQDLSSRIAFSPGNTLATLTIQDGGIGDADGAANGAIVHLGCFGYPVSNPPDQPLTVSPLNGASGVSLSPSLETGPFTDPDLNMHFSTQWQVSTDPLFATTDYSTASLTALTLLAVPEGTLSSNTTYYWRARYYDADCAVSAWSTTVSFTTLNLPPVSPILAAPADTTTEVSRIPALSTDGTYSDPEGNPHAQTQWQICATDDFTTPVYDLTSNTDLTTHTVPVASILNRTTLYYWRARFIDDQGSLSSWSAVFSFTTTANTPPDQPTLVSPADASIDANTTPILQTNAFTDLDGDTHLMTDWQISTASDFANLLYNNQSSGNLTSISIPDMILNGGSLYYWRARHYDNQTPSGVSPWSLPFTFTTVNQAADINANGIPDTQEVPAYVDLDADGTPDINQIDIKSVQTLVGGGRIGVKTAGGVTGISSAKSVDPTSITDTTSRPEVMPIGLIGFKAAVAAPGDTGTVTVYLSDPAPISAWYHYSADSGWLDLSSQAVFNAERDMVTLTIQDGGTGDADHIANGVIVHLGGFGFAASSPPEQPALSSPANGTVDESLSPALAAGAFTDPEGNSHYRTQWQVSTASDFSSLVMDINTTIHLTQITIPATVLNQNTLYYWRVRYTDNYYAVSSWSAAFTFTTILTNDDANADSVPDLLELDPAIDMDVDLDNNDTADLGQTDIKCLQSLVGVFGNEMIGVKQTADVTGILRINSIDPAGIADTAGRPGVLPFGLISMKLAVVNAGQNAQVEIYFSDPAPLSAWYTYDTVDGWRDMTHLATFSADRKTVTLTIQDGGYGDHDGATNGMIVHTGGFGFPASANAPAVPGIAVPGDGSLTPALQAGAFADLDGDSHFKTHWQVSTTDNFSTLVLDRITGPVTSLAIPYGMLTAGTTYYWRAQFYDNYYTASGWPVAAGFTTGTDPNDLNTNGIPDAQEVDAGIDLDGNGTADNAQTDIKSVNTIIGGGQMGIKASTNVFSIDAIQSVDPATLPDGGDGKPASMPLGILDFRITVTTPGDTAQVVVYFSQAAPAAEWFKYDPISSWTNYSNHAVFAADMLSVTLTLKDGAFGDADGVANGIIIDPSGPGKLVVDPVNPSPGGSGDTDSGGGCFISSMLHD